KIWRSPSPATRTSSSRNESVSPSKSTRKPSDNGYGTGFSLYAVSMSPRVWSSRITKRAKCRRSNRPKGTSAFIGSTTPGCVFIVARSLRNSASLVTSAHTMKLACGITRCSSGRKLQGEMDCRLVVPIDLAEVRVRRNQAYLIAYAFGHDGSLRVVEDDARLPIE